MSPTYSRDTLRDDVNSRLHNKIGIISNVNDAINRTALEVWRETDFRSAKRRAALAPNLFDDIFHYTCPTDMKGFSIIDLQRQKDDRPKTEAWILTEEEEFDRNKHSVNNMLAFSDRDFTRKLLIAKQLDDTGITIDDFDAVGDWVAFGDTENITLDNDNYVKGSGSIKWDITDAGGTTAGLRNASLTAFDLTDFLASGSVFTWVYLTSATDVTNLIVELGDSAATYYRMTATTTNEGLAFADGWNLIRWALSGRTAVGGTVTGTACVYGAIYMTKAVGKISEVDYRFDNLILKSGDYYNIIYYTKYPWQSATGTYLENSTEDTDLLNVDADEYNLVLEKCVDKLGRIVREYRDADDARVMYREMRQDYIGSYPSESINLQTTYYRFGSIEGY